MTSLPRDVLDKVLAVITHFLTMGSSTVVVAIGAGAIVVVSIGVIVIVGSGSVGDESGLLQALRVSIKPAMAMTLSLDLREELHWEEVTATTRVAKYCVTSEASPRH